MSNVKSAVPLTDRILRLVAPFHLPEKTLAEVKRVLDEHVAEEEAKNTPPKKEIFRVARIKRKSMAATDGRGIATRWAIYVNNASGIDYHWITYRAAGDSNVENLILCCREDIHVNEIKTAVKERGFDKFRYSCRLGSLYDVREYMDMVRVTPGMTIPSNSSAIIVTRDLDGGFIQLGLVAAKAPLLGKL